MPETVRLTLPGKPEYVSLARLAAGEAAARSGLDHDAQRDMQLAVSEACTHVLRHVGEAGAYALTFSSAEGELSVEVTQRQCELTEPMEYEDAGLGLMLIRGLTDDLVVEDEGAEMTVRFARRTAGA